MSRLVENPLFTCEDTDMVIIRDPKVSSTPSNHQNVKGKKVIRTFSEDSQQTLPFSCDKCSQSFSDSRALDLHKNNVCQDSACSVSCDFPAMTSTMSKCEETNQINSPLKTLDKGIGLGREKSTVKKYRKNYHVRANQLNKKAKELTPSDIKELEASWNEWKAKSIVPAEVRNQTFICGFCFQQLDSLLSLKDHNKTHPYSNRPKQCRLCHCYVSAASDLNRHVITHIGKTFDPDHLKKEIENRRIRANFGYPQKNKSKKVVESSGLANNIIRKDSQGFHKCNICHRKFSWISNLCTHKKKHGLEKSHECQVCRKIFNTPSQLGTHESDHKIEEIVCRFCEDNFNTMSGLKDHIRSRHSNLVGSSHHNEDKDVSSTFSDSHKNTMKIKGKKTTNGKYMCNICQKSFSFLGNMKKHKEKHGLKKSKECQICKKLFQSSDQLKNHEASHQNEEVCKSNLTASQANVNLKVECDICHVPVLHLRKHKIRHRKTILECKVCRKICRNQNHFNVHSKLHKNKTGRHDFNMKDQPKEQTKTSSQPGTDKEMCNICHNYISSDYIVKHKKKHGNSKFECQVCFKLFQNANILKGHMRLHKDDQTTENQQCMVKEEIWSSVKKQAEDHRKKDKSNEPTKFDDNKKKKTCKICHSTVENLEKHMNKHGNCNYECQLCRKLFRTPWELKSHEKSHNIGEIKCHVCEKKCDSIGDLQEHCKTSHRKIDQTQEIFTTTSSSISYQGRIYVMFSLLLIIITDSQIE